MRATGFDLRKGELRFTTLDGSIAKPTFVNHGRRVFDSGTPLSSLMDWFKQSFVEIINAEAPNIVAYRISLNATSVAQIAYLHFPWGILNLLAHDRELRTFSCNKNTFTAKKFLLSKGVDPITELESYIGVHPPHWDETQKNSALAAWAALRG